MSLHVNQSGVWEEVKKLHVKNSGVWNEVQGAWVKNGGIWEKTFEPIVTPPSEGMVLEVEIPDGNLGFEIACYSTDDEYNAEIAWGDGETSLITSEFDQDLVHTYQSAGTYIIEITGTFPNISMGFVGTITDSQEKLKKVLNLGHLGFTRLENSFEYCGLTDFIAGETDTSLINDFSSMFTGCSFLVNVDMAGIDSENVTTFDSMFRLCESLTSLDLSSLNTQNVEDFSDMFSGCSSLTSINLSGIDTSSATTFYYMFNACGFFSQRTGLADFNIGNLTDAGYMLSGGSGISTAEYDELLVNWQAQPHQQGVSISFGTSMYTAGSAAETARQALIDDDGWSISDGGPV